MKIKTFCDKTLVRPFVHRSASAGEVAVTTLVLLSLQLVMLAAAGARNALAVIAACVAASLCAHVAGGRRRIPSAMYVAQGIVCGMLLPESFPPVTAFFIVLCTMLLVKYDSGDLAGDWVNSAVVSVAVAWIVGMGAFPQTDALRDFLRERNPSRLLIQSGAFRALGFDSSVTAALNGSIFGFMHMSIPDGYVSLFWDNGSAIPAFRFNALTLVSSAVLFASGMRCPLIPSCFLASYCTLVRFVGPLFFGGAVGQGDMLLALLTGGTLFFATFVIQCWGTTPVTRWGKAIYGILCGVLAFFIAGSGVSSVGMAFAALSANLLSPLIQLWEDARNKKSLRAMLAPSAPEREEEP